MLPWQVLADNDYPIQPLVNEAHCNVAWVLNKKLVKVVVKYLHPLLLLPKETHKQDLNQLVWQPPKMERLGDQLLAVD